MLLYSENPQADRAFFRDVLGFASADAGGGWLILALPAAEAALHPTDGDNRLLVHGGRRCWARCFSGALSDVRRRQGLRQTPSDKRDHMQSHGAGAVGNQDYDSAAQRRDWHLPAAASDGVGAEGEVAGQQFEIQCHPEGDSRATKLEVDAVYIQLSGRVQQAGSNLRSPSLVTNLPCI
jgi:hypothetical protein